MGVAKQKQIERPSVIKVGVYSPYLHILGGGERYLLSIASYCSRNSDTQIFGDKSVVKKAQETLHVPLQKCTCIIPSKLTDLNAFAKVRFLGSFDLFFCMTDGSLFFPSAEKNFLIIQSPAHIPPQTFSNKLKIKRWNIICYSKFMFDIIKDRLGVNSIQLPPPVSTLDFSAEARQKKNIILTVGRFFSGLHDKKQEELIRIFIKNYKKKFIGWELHLAGGVTQESGEKLVEKLKKMTVGYPIFIHQNIPFGDLVDLYRSARIYWHAAGVGEDMTLHPERAEHFGITTVEAMSAGAVPVVFQAGGQVDIIADTHDGFFWQTEGDLVRKTEELMKNRSLWEKMSSCAIRKSSKYSYTRFYEKLEEIVR